MTDKKVIKRVKKVEAERKFIDVDTSTNATFNKGYSKSEEQQPPLNTLVKKSSLAVSTILQWAFLVGLGLIIFFGYGFSWPVFPTMPGYLVLVVSLSLAFTWVEVLKWWPRVKPFSCVKCMTGWFALILALLFHVEFWYFYLFIGLFVGAMWSAIKMRYL